MDLGVVGIKNKIDTFISEVYTWRNVNKLPELSTYEDLKKKEIIGNEYREVQIYYNKISDYKSKLIALKGHLIKEKDGYTDRQALRTIDSILEYIDEAIKVLDNDAFSSRQRLKFYETIIFLMTTINYGEY